MQRADHQANTHELGVTTPAHITRRNEIGGTLNVVEDTHTHVQAEQSESESYAPSSTGADVGTHSESDSESDSESGSDSGDYKSDGTPSLVSDDDTLPDMEFVDTNENVAGVIAALDEESFDAANPAFPGHAVAREGRLEFAGFQARLSIITAVAGGGIAISPLRRWLIGEGDHWTPFHPQYAGGWK